MALLQTAGTKGLILAADSQLLREVNRSFYHAEAYRYPLALFGMPDGRTGLAHCQLTTTGWKSKMRPAVNH